MSAKGKKSKCKFFLENNLRLTIFPRKNLEYEITELLADFDKYFESFNAFLFFKTIRAGYRKVRPFL